MLNAGCQRFSSPLNKPLNNLSGESLFIQKDTIDAVRERANIEEIVKLYVPTLVKKGKNYTGLCPFHNEKTPSFIVSPDKQIFHCFGCHEGGNIFSFISKIEGVDFPESVRFVAKQVGIEIKEEKNSDSDRFDVVKKINNYAMNFFSSYIKSVNGKNGEKYLIERGVSKESIESFKLGFVPETWNLFTDSLKKRGIDLKIAENIGLVSTSDKKGQIHYFDKFRNRVMFPIFSVNGDVVAFGGRVIGDGNPKYLNSPESFLFKKREILYGLNFAKKSIIDLKRAIIVEGYLDVIGCHQVGVTNCVAPLGTALTEEQIRRLSRYCSEIIILFDSDEAGVKASLKSIDVGENINVDIKIASLAEGDPFDCIINKGVREFMSVVDSAVNPIDYKINLLMKNLTVIGKIKTMMKIFSVIKNIKLKTEQALYLDKVSSLLEMEGSLVKSDFNNFIQNKGKPVPVKPIVEVKQKDNSVVRGYKDLVSLICNYPELIEKASLDISFDDMPEEISKNILKTIYEQYNNDEDFSINKLFDIIEDSKEIDFLNNVIDLNNDIENPSAVYNDIYLNIRLHEIDGKIDRYAVLLKKPDKYSQEYLVEIEVLRREKEKLVKHLYNRTTRKI